MANIEKMISEPTKVNSEELAISVEELRKIIRQELGAVMKSSGKRGTPVAYKEDVIQNWLQMLNRANLAVSKASKGSLNKPEK